MDHEILSAVQGCLCPGDRCVIYIEAGLVQDWVKMSRVLALVQRSDEHGFLIFISNKPKVTSPTDLVIETAFPVNDEFKCEIDTTGIDLGGGVDVYVKVTSQKVKLLFELPFSPRTNAFVTEVSRAIEAFALRIEPFPGFSWLKAYQPTKPDALSPCLDAILLTNQTAALTISDGTGGGITPIVEFLQNTEPAKKPLEEAFPKDKTTSKGSLGFEDNFSDIVPDEKLNHFSKEMPQAKDPFSDKNVKNAVEIESPDGFGNIPRHSIAIGATPLAARESVVKLQMGMREEDYTNIRQFRVFTGTWNVNGKSPTVSLADWLSCDPEPPDVYAIGFQELDLSTEVYIFNDTAKEGEWLCAVINGLHPKAKYQKVKLVRLIGMMLVVFVKIEHYPYVSSVAGETVGTGIMGKMGNKGGVAIRLDLHNTSMCFVNCHLAAHIEEFERRNQDYNDICSRMSFSQFKPPRTIKDHEQIFWFGDMNYRIMDLDLERVKALIDKQCYSMLLEHDQLKIQHSLKKIFVGFTEGSIHFVPTYKYDPGTNDWDSSEKSRPPAWCDRCLWRGKHISQLIYRCHPSMLISDHKPVSALFQSGVKVVDEVKYRKIYEEVMKKLDKLENEFLPQVAVDKTEIHFEDVRFIEPQTRYLTIANTGQVPVQLEFIKKLNDTSYCKEWLNINPYASFIMPGEKCDIELKVYVDKRTAWKLNTVKDRIYDILVLHLEGGKDIFITVAGNYIPSCFGSSLEALVHMPGPIRDVPVAKLIELEIKNPKEVKKPLFEIPKEIWILVDHLFKYGLTQEDLFQQPGLGAEIQRIRDRLDVGWPEHVPGSVHSVAEAFLLFLEALAEPVIPFSFHDKCLDCSNNYILSRQVISEIPDVHRKVFHYLIIFLREIRQHSNHNKLDPKMLATLFGSILLRSPPSKSSRNNQQVVERKKATFVYHFLVNDYDEN